MDDSKKERGSMAAHTNGLFRNDAFSHVQLHLQKATL